MKSTLDLVASVLFFSDYKSSFLVILVLLVILIFVLILLVVLVLFVLIILVLVVILVLVLILVLVIHKKSPRFQPLLSVKRGEIYYIPNNFFAFSRAAVNI